MTREFLKTDNPSHLIPVESNIEIEKYQEELSDFLVKIFAELNLELPDKSPLKSAISGESSEIMKSVYIAASVELSLIIKTADLRQSGRAIDRDVAKNVCEELNSLAFKRSSSPELEKERIITEAYWKKIGQGDLHKGIEKFELLISRINQETDQAKKNLLMLIAQIIDPGAIGKTKEEITLKRSEYASVGVCAGVERNMFAALSGKHLKQGQGDIAVVLGNNDKPIMLEKVGFAYGDENSCLTLRPVRIDGILFPAGMILAAKRKISSGNYPKLEKNGAITCTTRLSDYDGFNPERLSVISDEPVRRALSCGKYYSNQLPEGILGGRVKDKSGKGEYINIDWVTPENLYEFVSDYLSEK